LKNWDKHEETLLFVEKAIQLWKETKSTDVKDTATMCAKFELLRSGWTGEEASAISLYCSLLYQNDFSKGVLAALLIIAVIVSVPVLSQVIF
jgi:hypothetical protein